MSNRGIFISFEGIDGAGKSTHIDGLAGALRGQGRALVQTREPGGTPLAEKLRALLLAEPMDDLTELLLMFAARRDHLLRVIEPALARGDMVLCDRFTDASFAYQGGGRGLSLDVLSNLEQWVQAVPSQEENLPLNFRQPDLTLWFDLPPLEAAQRLAGARLPDKFEAQPLAFFTRVADAYAQRLAASNGRIVRIDAAQSRGAVWQQVKQALVQRGWLAALTTGAQT